MILKKLVVGPFASNCYIVGSESHQEGMVIDPGANARGILRGVQDLGLDIKFIVLTHGHVDHIGAVKEVKEATGAEVWLFTLVMLGLCGGCRGVPSIIFRFRHPQTGCFRTEIGWRLVTYNSWFCIPRAIAQEVSASWATGWYFPEIPCSIVVSAGRISLMAATTN